MATLTPEVAATARVPTLQDKVYKDECMYSFDSPLSPDGLYTSLTTFESFGKQFVRDHFQRHAHPLYLRQIHRRMRKQDPVTEANGDANAAPTKLAIGVEGGFQLNVSPYDVAKRLSIVCFPGEHEYAYPSDDIPRNVVEAVEALLKRDSVEIVDKVAMEWEDEARKETTYAKDLIQLDVTEEQKRILSDPSKWECAESGLKTNLWMNLSTGYIGSGRKNWDGTGGTGAAQRHYEETGGNFPLAVKLGTISPQGADVYCYAPDENDMVIDPLLKEHLAHFGIDMNAQKRTERTMTEMVVELNMNYDFSKITESGSELVPLVGPGYVGLDNLGNSCYMASILQLLFTVPEVSRRYLDGASTILQSAPAGDPTDDLLSAMVKMASGLLSDRYAQPIPIYEPLPSDAKSGDLPVKVSPKRDSDEPYASVRPFMFKRLIGRNHPEFSTARQQDASEFYQHLLDKLALAERKGAHARLMSPSDNLDEFLTTSSLFAFDAEERLECQQSKKSRYITMVENMLSIPIPLEKATNTDVYKEYEERTSKRQKTDGNGVKTDAEEPVKLHIPFEACLESFAADQLIDDFMSPATSQKGVALKRTRFRTFPEYLVINLKKYTFDPQTHALKKLDVIIPMPNELDLELLRSKGPATGEELLPEVEDGAMDVETAQPQANPEIVSKLMEMGFSENGSKRAALATNNAGADAGMEWVFAHMEDADFNDPLPPVGARSSGTTSAAQSDELKSLVGMGFSEKQSRAALLANNNVVDRAVDWLFSQGDGLDAAVESVLESEATNGAECSLGKKFVDGPGKYTLLGFASHIGSSPHCGHYVAHIVKDEIFVLFNDNKVAVSQNPPSDMGFLYLYRRSS